MNADEIIIFLIILTGIYFMLVPILRDPIYAFKSMVRGMKSTDNWRFTILFFPIWGPIWVIDKLLGTKIFIKDIDDASIARDLDINEYQKFILINSTDLNYIKNVLSRFQNEYNPNEYNSDLSKTKTLATLTKKEIILRFDNHIGFDTFKLLVQSIDNSAPLKIVYNIKGVMINQTDKENSFFIQFNTDYYPKLLGKTYSNKKMYAILYDSKNGGDRIYLNSNFDYIKKFDFDDFIEETNGLIFKELKISPVHNLV